VINKELTLFREKKNRHTPRNEHVIMQIRKY
jgi:hypothetical protein